MRRAETPACWTIPRGCRSRVASGSSRPIAPAWFRASTRSWWGGLRWSSEQAAPARRTPWIRPPASSCSSGSAIRSGPANPWPSCTPPTSRACRRARPGSGPRWPSARLPPHRRRWSSNASHRRLARMRILYGVVGEGMGHAIRSRVILDELVQRHDVQVVVSGRAHDYLAKRANDHLQVKKIWGFTIVTEDNEVRNFRTLLENVKGALTGGWPQNIKTYFEIADTFRPEAVIC